VAVWQNENISVYFMVLERISILTRLLPAIPEQWKILPAFEISIICRKACIRL
jgi:hypothetical protein